MDADRLTERAHWDHVHRAGGDGGGRRALAQRILGRERADFLYQGGYVAQRFRQLLAPHVRPGDRVLEVGSAPGLHLAKLARQLDLDPWGLDYSPDGVAANRATFGAFGYDPSQVIHGDFFGDDVATTHAARFDVVMSHGFVEHFRDVRPVIARHVALTRPGGVVCVSVPNLRGVNGALTRFFNRPLLDAHNLDIMTRDAFAALFSDQGLEPIYCGYLGVFSIGLQYAPATSARRHLLRPAAWLQVPLELAQRRLFGDRSPELPAWSPYLYYLGRVTRSAGRDAT